MIHPFNSIVYTKASIARVNYQPLVFTAENAKYHHEFKIEPIDAHSRDE